MDSWTVSYWEANMDYCKGFLYNKTNWNTIPRFDHITDLRLYEKKLVRFKCMIQDIRNPVFYSEQYEILDTTTNIKSYRSGKYRDFILYNDQEEILTESPVPKECQVLHCVNIPNLNTWAEQIDMGSKQLLDVPESSTDSISPISNLNAEKRHIKETENNLTHKNKYPRIFTPSTAENSQSPNANCSEASDTELKSKACIVNLYDVDSDRIKLNDVIEIVGFLSTGIHSNIPEDESCEDDNNMECESSILNVPRIHAVACCPYMVQFPEIYPSDEETVLKEAVNIKEDLWLILSQVLAGDTLAADYMICHLISSVFSRCDTVANGKFSLNLSNFPATALGSKYTSMLYKLISLFVQKSHYYPITSQNLNTTAMIPKKDYDKDCLVTGLLQLSHGTHMILDETKLEPGQLTDKGVRNVNALNSIINNQRLSYNFEYYDVDFNTDVPILSLSVGKSLLQNDCHLPMEPHSSCLNDLEDIFHRVENQLTGALLSKLRIYLYVVRNLKYDIPSSLQQVISDTYVKMRQERSDVNADDLSRLLVIARLNALSRGQNVLHEEDWKRACYMENLRMARLNAADLYQE